MVLSYNFVRSTKPTYCKKHVLDGMREANNKPCLYYTCGWRPIVNCEGSKTAVFCRQHAEYDMVDIRCQWCVRGDCTKRPRCNLENMAGRTTSYLLRTEWLTSALAGHPSIDSSTVVGALRRASTDGLPTVRVQLKDDIVEYPVASVTVGAVRESVDCLEQWRSGVDWKQPTRCRDHASPENVIDGDTAAPVGMAHRTGGANSKHFPMALTHTSMTAAAMAEQVLNESVTSYTSYRFLRSGGTSNRRPRKQAKAGRC